MKEFFYKAVKYVTRMFRKLNISKKIMLLYIFVVFIPVLIFMLIFYSKNSSIIEGEVTKSMLQAVRQIEVNINDRLENIVDISNIIFSNIDVRNAIDSSIETSLSQQYDEVSYLTRIVTSFSSKKDVYNIRIFVNDSKYYSKEGVYFYPISSILGTELIKKVEDANGAIYWQECHPENNIDQKDQQVISAVRIVRSLKNFQTINGILSIDVKEDTLYNILSRTTLSKNSNILIVGETGNIISVKDKSLIGNKYPGWNEISSTGMDEGIIKSKKSTPGSYFIFTTIRGTGWKIVAEIPVGDVTGSSSAFNAVTSIIAIVATFGVFLLILFISLGWIANSFNKKVKAMVLDIEQEGYGSLNESLV